MKRQNRRMSKIVLDTNVPTIASISPQLCQDKELVMQKKCVEYIGNLVKCKETKLVLDADFEILKEYQKNVCKNSNIGKIFFKWLYSYYNQIQPEDIVKLQKNKFGQYIDFPYDENTKNFDESDKKFIALSNAHAEKPPIIEASDGKWLGYEAAFAKYGIVIEFLDREYAQRMYEKKIVNKGSK